MRGLVVLVALLPAFFLVQSVAPTRGEAGTGIVLKLVGQFNQPVFVTNAGDSRLFVVERLGTIRVVDGNQTSTFLDIHSLVRTFYDEQGLLGLAFHPNYVNNGLFYIYYVAPDRSLNLARYSVSGNPNVANPVGQILLTIQHPTYDNHNGGMLAFGPDGYLYVGVGDGGFHGDPNDNAQNTSLLLGKLLRLDVNAASPYAPASNPFVGVAGDDRIWAYGLRNPWRFSFDRVTGNLYTGDVGQDLWEEVDFQPAGIPGGQNYGWRIMEGTHCFNPDPCSQAGLTLPVVEYGHGPECSITGGYVYRGAQLPSLYGSYVYGDYCSGKVWTTSQANGWTPSLLLGTNYLISSFGQDQDGELYLADLSGGVYRFEASGGPTPLPTQTQTSTLVQTNTLTATATLVLTPTSTRTPTPTQGPGLTPTPTATGGPLPDLVILSMSVQATTSDQPIAVSVLVQNQGGADTGVGFHVHVHDGAPPAGPMVLHLVTSSLGPGGSRTVAGEIPPGRLAPGPHTLWAQVDGDDSIVESNEDNNTSTATVTLDPPPSSTLTATATAPSTSATATATPTRTVTVTATAAPALGGRGLSITAGNPIALRWRDGTTEDGYLVARFALGSGALITLPRAGKLGPGATGYTDNGPLPENTYCYAVLPTVGANALGLSDLVCDWQHVATGSQIPGQFTLRLDESTVATLAWTTTGAPDHYVLHTIPLDGSQAQTTNLPGEAMQTNAPTQGAPTCFVLVAYAGATTIGGTDGLCAIPNVQTLVATGGHPMLPGGVPRTLGGVVPQPRRTTGAP